ncbi:response regulator [Alistipes sp.]|uniref:response regulator n=1 Tax=Alistipes sp. TaxID=1872444 RepID=UPI003AF06163
MKEWIIANKEWLFSGIGVAVLGWLGAYIYRKIWKRDPLQTQTQPQTQTQSQVVNVNIGTHTSRQEQPVKNCYVDVKAKVRILFIDDEKFTMINILKKAGWKNIEYKKDLSDLDDYAVLSANVIFVDINGVGCSLFRNQGLGLAAAIKNKHQDKRVIIYSAEPNGDRFDNALRQVDACLPKNAEPIEFMNLIEEYARTL